MLLRPNHSPRRLCLRTARMLVRGPAQGLMAHTAIPALLCSLTALLCSLTAPPGLAAGTSDAAPASDTAPTVTVYFEHRPPLMGQALMDKALAGQTPVNSTTTEKAPTAEAEPAGLIVDRVRKGLTAAALDVRWQYESAPRQLQALLSAATPACGIGWYHTAERARVYRYSKPVFTPMPASLLVSATDKRFDQFTRFEDVLKNRLVRLVRAKPYIVSREVQAFYDRYPDAPVVTFSGEKHADLARMITNRRADYFVSSAEENLFLLSSNPEYGNQLRAVTYPDIPAGQDLYMICSRAVPEKWLQRFNDGFARANLPRPPGA